MIFATLLAAAVSEGSERPRARANELKGRLGLQAPARLTGTLSRLAHIERQHGLLGRRMAEAILISSGEIGDFLSGTADIGGGRDLQVWGVEIRTPTWRLSKLPVGVDLFLPRYSSDKHRMLRDNMRSFFMRAGLLGADLWVRSGFLDADGGLVAEGQPRSDIDAYLPALVNMGMWFISDERSRDELRAQMRAAVDRTALNQNLTWGLFYQDQRGAMVNQPAEVKLGTFVGCVIANMRDHGVFDYLDVETPPNLLQMTPADLFAASRRWHDTFRNATGFGEPARPGIVVARWPDGGRIERLVTPRQLEQEGVAMAHCVGGYWPSVRDGRAIIYSYRDADGVSKGTVELSRGSGGRYVIEQAKGPENQAISDQAALARLRAYIMGHSCIEDRSGELGTSGLRLGSDGSPVIILSDDQMKAITLPEGWDEAAVDGSDHDSFTIRRVAHRTRESQRIRRYIEEMVDELGAVQGMDDDEYAKHLRDVKGYDEYEIEQRLQDPQRGWDLVVGIQEMIGGLSEEFEEQRIDLNDFLPGEHYIEDHTGLYPFQGMSARSLRVYGIHHPSFESEEVFTYILVDYDHEPPRISVQNWAYMDRGHSLRGEGSYDSLGEALLGAGVLITRADYERQVGPMLSNDKLADGMEMLHGGVDDGGGTWEDMGLSNFEVIEEAAKADAPLDPDMRRILERGE